ncbi:T9SS type A sorting domain-containing protein [bacterium]|nr:T9SS type A sorting domain-containing protein [bacterium]
MVLIIYPTIYPQSSLGTKDELLGNAILSGYVNSVTGGALPIELIEFDGYYDNNHISIKWKTTSETNNEYFELFKSNNGIDFYKIYQIDGAGNSTSTKSYTYDDNDINSDILYYKLSQTDFDGKNTESNIISIKNYDDIFDFSINKDNIRLILNKNDEYRVIITDINGRIFFNRLFSSMNSIDIENNLKHGTYIISIISNGNILSKTFIN